MESQMALSEGESVQYRKALYFQFSATMDGGVLYDE